MTARIARIRAIGYAAALLAVAVALTWARLPAPARIAPYADSVGAPRP